VFFKILLKIVSYNCIIFEEREKYVGRLDLKCHILEVLLVVAMIASRSLELQSVWVS
jgi:hypothetical protein